MNKKKSLLTDYVVLLLLDDIEVIFTASVNS